jgi:hypothetical protein
MIALARRYRGFLLLALVVMLLAGPVSAQENLSVTVTTDKQTYALGQAIIISVSVQQFGAAVASVSIFYELRGPQNQAITSGFGITDSNGKYTKTATVANDFPLGSCTVYVSVSANGQTASATSAFQTIPEFNSGVGALLVQTFVLLIAIMAIKSRRRSRAA